MNRLVGIVALCAARACVSAFSAATELARVSPVCSVTSRASSVINTSPARTRSPALTRMPAIVATIRLEMDADSRAATTPPASSRSVVSIAATGTTVTGIGSSAFASARCSPPPQADTPPATRPRATIPINRFMTITSLAPRPFLKAVRARVRAPPSEESGPCRRSWPATLPAAPPRQPAARRSPSPARPRTGRG